jgi:propanediol utilization protein
MSKQVKVEVSARHVHLSQKDLDVLFGVGYELTFFKELSQPGQFAANEKVDVISESGEFKGVRILGPVRPESQVEISQSDARVLKISAPLRLSGDIDGSASVKLVGPKGEVVLDKGVIVAKRHMHCTPETAVELGLSNGANIKVKVGDFGVRGLIFDNVKVPKENLLPNKSGLGAPLGCLDSARYGIAWGAIGAAMDCYDTALRYAKERIQFDKPIAGTQLQQKKLAEMITEITKAQLLTWRLGVLRNEGKATTAQISMAKRNNVDMAINIAREARQILGGMGITGEYSIMRHSMNLESVITYEGTHDIHLLITGADITGIPAFK